MNDENILPETVPISINGNLYWMPKAHFKDLGERISELEIKQDNDHMVIKNLVSSLDVLEEEQKALHQAITNETKANLTEIAKLREDLEKL